MKINKLEKMNYGQLFQLQDNSEKILKYFNYNIEEDSKLQRLSEAVDTAPTAEECYIEYIIYLSALIEKAEYIFYKNKKLTVNELAETIK